MNIKRKSEYIGALGALLVHVAIIALLILVSFAIPHPDEEAGGVPVMMGDVDAAYGNYDPSTMVDVEVLPEEVPAPQPEWPVLLVKVRKWGEVKVRLLQEKELKEVKTVIL